MDDPNLKVIDNFMKKYIFDPPTSRTITSTSYGPIVFYPKMPAIKKVIFNNPATIVIWDDGTKTVVKTKKKDKFVKEYGLAIAIAKKYFGSRAQFLQAIEEASDAN